jgi:small GTP-binding protein
MIVDFKWKVVVVGDPTVGKTTLMLRYTEKKFNELYIPTVGVQVSIKQIPIKIPKKKEKRLVELNIWDIAGHVKFQHIRKIFYEGAQAFLCLYDCTNEESYNNTSEWISDIQEQIGNQYGILIGNKSDLKKQRVISAEQGKEKADSYLLDFLETSAKTGENVEDVFELLTVKLLEMFG